MVTYNWIWRFNIQKRIKRKRWWWWSGNGGSGEFFLLPKKKGTQMMVVVMISWVRSIYDSYYIISGCRLPHPLASDLSFPRYWNYLRKHTFVLEAYIDRVNWICWDLFHHTSWQWFI
ncbi:hypothetical protein C5167_005142 [Papaver somniferum]|uniref:Uncharacterized protein n=1 Tax=Papaver somniferum TaxID=3469 RepID=A0A4Y7JAK3_PAPSO|nr:uncharacterized protein LOC113275200 isoform X1 [Papaver somniferum]RZC57847.1 hypothetical protein C5167_005142 [Papaver somniferum]